MCFGALVVYVSLFISVLSNAMVQSRAKVLSKYKIQLRCVVLSDILVQLSIMVLYQ